MVSIKELTVAKKFGPGYFVKEQMELRGWVQEELADIMDLSLKHMNSILLDKQPLTIENAFKLFLVFNTSPQYWLNLDRDYQLWLLSTKVRPASMVECKALIYNHMPLRDMVKKGWLNEAKSIDSLTKQVKEFWDTDKLDFSFLETQFFPFYKPSDSLNPFEVRYAATWFQMAKKISREFDVPLYDKRLLERLYLRLREYSNLKNGIGLFLKELNACGVKFFVLPHLEKTFIDGAAFLHDNVPVLAYTGRIRRIDDFWFTIAHEIAHILHHLDENTPFIIDRFDEKSTENKEKEANIMATTLLKHQDILTCLEPHFNYLTLPKIQECAAKTDVHPAIIIGALTVNNKISTRNQRLFNDNVLNMIPESYLHKSMLL